MGLAGIKSACGRLVPSQALVGGPLPCPFQPLEVPVLEAYGFFLKDVSLSLCHISFPGHDSLDSFTL